MVENADDIARTCLRPIRGCATDDQYCDVLARVTAAIEASDREAIRLTKAEIQSGMTRVKWAENLILQLPETHDGRNSWLLNYGVGPESDAIRERNAERRSRR